MNLEWIMAFSREVWERIATISKRSWASSDNENCSIREENWRNEKEDYVQDWIFGNSIDWNKT